jgi:hypothetical protein
MRLGIRVLPYRLEANLKVGNRPYEKTYGDKVMPMIVEAMQDGLKA